MADKTDGNSPQHYENLHHIIQRGITRYMNLHPDCKTDIAVQVLREAAAALSSHHD